MKNYKNIQSTFRTLNHSDWAGMSIYNQVVLQPSQKGGGTWT
jgi:hypothetical protein